MPQMGLEVQQYRLQSGAGWHVDGGKELQGGVVGWTVAGGKRLQPCVEVTNGGQDADCFLPCHCGPANTHIW